MTENSSNSSNTLTCVLPPWFAKTNENVQLFVYYILMPPNFVVSFILHSIILYAFWHRSKSSDSNGVYSYQKYIMIVNTLEIVGFALYVISFHWCSASTGDLASRCSRNYSIMWYGHHLSFVLGNGLTTTRLYLSISVSVDRVLALGLPHQYRTLSKDRTRRIVLIVCVIIGLSTSTFDAFRLNLIYDSKKGRYAKQLNVDFVDSPLGRALSWFRNFARVFGLGVLIVANILIIRLYRRQVLQNLTAVGKINDRREMAKRAEERTLIALTITQSSLTAVDMICLCTFYAAQYMAPKFSGCSGRLMTPVLDFVFQISNLTQFFAVILVRTPLRTMIVGTCLRWFSRIIAWRHRLRSRRSESASQRVITNSRGGFRQARTWSTQTVDSVL